MTWIPHRPRSFTFSLILILTVPTFGMKALEAPAANAGFETAIPIHGRLNAAPPPQMLDALNVGLYRNGTPLGSQLPDSEVIAQIYYYARYAKAIKIFSALNNGHRLAAKVAHQLGVAVSVTCSFDSQATVQLEFDSLVSMAQAGLVDVAVIGNETLLFNKLNPNAQTNHDMLLNYINQFHAQFPAILVTTADTYDQLTLPQNADILNACSVIYANIYPFHEASSIAHAMESLDRAYQSVVAKANGKTVVVSETGWPTNFSSAGGSNGAPVDLAAGAFYFNAVESWSKAKSVLVFYFEASDEAAKGTNNGFGLFDDTGNLKLGYSDVFAGQFLADNWSGATVVGPGGAPAILLTQIPAVGDAMTLLAGRAVNIAPANFRVAVYIFVPGFGWVTKPTQANPATSILSDGTWSCVIVSGGSDASATMIQAFLIDSNTTPPFLFGSQTPPSIPGAPSVQATRAPGVLPPTVSAGSDGIVTIPNTFALGGSISAGATAAWSQISGPGVATFGDPNSPTSSVSFSQTGYYQLCLAASSGGLMSYSAVAVRAYAATDFNHAPVVSSGPAPTSNMDYVGIPTSLTVNATDADGDALSYAWNFGDDTTMTLLNAAAAHTYTAAGTYTVTVLIADGRGGSVTASAVVAINPNNSVSSPPTITSSLSAPGTAGIQFTYTITAAGTAPITFTAAPLPAGLTFNGSTISGTPTAAGTTNVILTAANGTAPNDQKTLIITITGPATQAPVITSSLTASGTAGTSFTYTITAAGTTPITFTASPLPSGLALSGDTISGTPTTAGTTNVILTAANSTVPTDQKTLVITVAAASTGGGGTGGTGGTSGTTGGGGTPTPVAIASGPTATPNPATVGQPVQFGCAASGKAPLTFAWTFGDGTSATGDIVTHAFSPAGIYTVAVTATDNTGTTATAPLTLTVNAVKGGTPGSGAAILPMETDSDGDGFSDAVEAAAGTKAQSAANFPGDAAPIYAAMTVATIKHNAKKKILSISGTLHIPASFTTAGKFAIVDIDSFTQKFTLDAKGGGKTGKDTFKVTIKVKKKVVAEQNAKYKISLTNIPSTVRPAPDILILIGNLAFSVK